VARDRGEPGGGVARHRPSAQSAERGDEDLLRRVLGLVPVAEDRAADRAHLVSVLEVEPLELDARMGDYGRHAGISIYRRLGASGWRGAQKHPNGLPRRVGGRGPGSVAPPPAVLYGTGIAQAAGGASAVPPVWFASWTKVSSAVSCAFVFPP